MDLDIVASKDPRNGQSCDAPQQADSAKGSVELQKEVNHLEERPYACSHCNKTFKRKPFHRCESYIYALLDRSYFQVFESLLSIFLKVLSECANFITFAFARPPFM